jgi:hypothetical protein
MNKLIYALTFILFLHCTFKIENCSAQWVQMSNGIGTDKIVHALTSNGSYIFAGAEGSGVYVSSNNGTSWSQTSLDSLNVSCFAVSGNKVFAGVNGSPNASNGVYVTTNNGTSWTHIGLGTQDIYCLNVFGDVLLAGGYGVYLTLVAGGNWTLTSYNDQVISSIETIGSTIFAGTPNNPSCSVHRSTNNCITWSETALYDKEVSSLAALGNTNFVAGSSRGVYISPVSGSLWTSAGLSNDTITTVITMGSNIFACTLGNFPNWSPGVFLSSNNGSSWRNRNQGLSFYTLVPEVLTLLIVNNYIFAGTMSYGSVYRRSYSDIIGIQNISTEIPSAYSLSQNYPNPFNPKTKIKFDVPVDDPEGTPRIRGNDRVVLKVYDELGKEIETIVNEKLNAGTYEVTFDASKYPSGVYFYRMQVGEYNDTKKMILLK